MSTQYDDFSREVLRRAGGQRSAYPRLSEVIELAIFYSDDVKTANFIYGALLMTGVEDWGTAWEAAEWAYENLPGVTR